MMPSLLPPRKHPCLPALQVTPCSVFCETVSSVVERQQSHRCRGDRQCVCQPARVIASQPENRARGIFSKTELLLPGFFSSLLQPLLPPLSCLIPSASFELQSRHTHRSRAACFVARFFHTQHSIPLAFGEHGRCPINQDPS